MSNILAVVGDKALAMLLKERLEYTGQHHVRLAFSEREALEAINRHAADLAIVDVDLEDAQPIELAHRLRQARPTLRIVWMPFLGEKLSEAMLSFDTQGILTKPFFMDDLPAVIAEALAKSQPQMAESLPKPVSLQTDVRATPLAEGSLNLAGDQESSLPAGQRRTMTNLPAAQDVLNRLALDLDADAVMIVDRQGHLLVQAGHISRKDALQLASILTNEIAATSDVAVFLKEKNGYFANNIHEGDEYRLFLVVLSSDGLALSVITRVGVPLGTVRFHVRQAVALLHSSFQ